MPIIWLNANDGSARCSLSLSVCWFLGWLWPVPIPLCCTVDARSPYPNVFNSQLPLIWALALAHFHTHAANRNFSSRSVLFRFLFFFQFKYIKITAIIYTYSVFFLIHILPNKLFLICLVFRVPIETFCFLSVCIAYTMAAWSKGVANNRPCIEATNWKFCSKNCRRFGLALTDRELYW